MQFLSNCKKDMVYCFRNTHEGYKYNLGGAMCSEGGALIALMRWPRMAECPRYVQCEH
ncbi:hypothetical protein SBF1_470017 [Candidatus Desulfosporosinus infrequens]|uniref:Uncharacterized protein n=1 Tax=Candidatus Desulfosporosinus infrequens TaxID=2043169 RepID=A0A2U3LDS3_9FIRM|nr:hypothetical protein SBF1_470017 [Candidatus Desulfosporosinus infrequens]